MAKSKLLPVLITCFCFFSAVAYAQDEFSLVRVGEHIPAFELETEKGILQSEDLKGKVVLINFFATWCGPCIKELPFVEKQIWNKYKDNVSFELLVIGREHTAKELSEFKAKKKFAMPFYPDKDRAVFGKFAKQNIPRKLSYRQKWKNYFCFRRFFA